MEGQLKQVRIDGAHFADRCVQQQMNLLWIDMSKQKFSAVQRRALFDAYGGRCFYTSVALDVGGFHIDHIIPEHLAEKPAALKELIRRLELPGEFDIRGYENLVPVAPNANLSKSGSRFSDANLRFFLERSQKSKDVAASSVAGLERNNTKMKVVLMLQHALDSGKVSYRDVAVLLEKTRGDADETFSLIEKLAFADASEIDAIKKTEVDSLRDRPVRLGENSHIDGLTLIRDDGVTRHVRTCREYDEAISAGFYADTTYAMKMEVFFRHQSGLLRAVEKAKVPRASFISSPMVGLSDWNLLPLSLFPTFGESGFDETSGVSYQDKISDGAISVIESRHNFLRLEGPLGQQLIEVARADFTGDGLEDILLFTYEWAIGGTFGYGDIAILSRSTSTGSFEIENI